VPVLMSGLDLPRAMMLMLLRRAVMRARQLRIGTVVAAEQKKKKKKKRKKKKTRRAEKKKKKKERTRWSDTLLWRRGDLPVSWVARIVAIWALSDHNLVLISFYGPLL